jgi:hypothetical protein
MFMLGSLHCVFCLSCSREGSSFDVLVNGQPALNLACSDFLGLGSDTNVQVRGWKHLHSHHNCSWAASAAALNVACSDSFGLGSNPNVQVRVTSAGKCVRLSDCGSRIKSRHMLNSALQQQQQQLQHIGRSAVNCQCYRSCIPVPLLHSAAHAACTVRYK